MPVEPRDSGSVKKTIDSAGVDYCATQHFLGNLHNPDSVPWLTCDPCPGKQGMLSLSGEPDYFGRNEISSGGDLSHYSSASLY